MEPRIRKTINVSLQSKKYCGPMNELINKWEDDGCNLSIQVCEQLLKLDKLEQSATFLNILNAFELTEKLAAVYKIDDKNKIEEILSKVIKLDTANLSEIFMTFNQIQESPIVETKRNVESSKPIEKPIIKVEPIAESVDTTDDTDDEESIGSEIPMDFLFNS